MNPILPERVHNADYIKRPIPKEMYVPDYYADEAAG